MSRYQLMENFLIDVVTVYPFPIDRSFMIFFPGESLLESQFDKSYTLLSSREKYKFYQVSDKKYRLLILKPDLLQNNQTLSEVFDALYTTYRIQPLTDLVIGINFYNDSMQDQLNTAIVELIQYFSRAPSFGLEKITIACTNNQLEHFMQVVHQLCDGRIETFSLNPNTRFELYDRIMCRSCRELPYEPYVTTCCFSVYCERCRTTCTKCFDCARSEVEFVLEPFLQSFFPEFRFTCRCNVELSFKEIRTHLYECEFTIFNCRIGDCKAEGTQAEIVAHIIHKHQDGINVKDILIDSSQEPLRRECPNCNRFTQNSNHCSSCDFTITSFPNILAKLSLE